MLLGHRGLGGLPVLNLVPLRLAGLFCAFALGSACVAQPEDSLEWGDTDDAAPPPADDDEPEPEPEEPDPLLDVPPPAEPEEDEACAALSETATLEKSPAEILFVVDNSPSMVEESNAVQQRLNSFSQQIVDAGIDMRVFLLTSYPHPGADPWLDTGICIDPPLGGGGCPYEDNNLPLFWHVQASIGSSQLLQRLLNHHEHWGQMMREDSVKHIIVVTDDDELLEADDFHEAFTALDPTYEDYILHGIVSLGCQQAAAIGDTYVQLAEQTGGTVADLCGQNFQPVFDTLSTAVIEGSGLSCDWALPEAPSGRVIDPDTVTVFLQNDVGQETEMERTEGPQGCGEGLLGWYYDDEESPSTIVACEQTCDILRDLQTATVSIDVGCAFAGEG